MEFRRIDATTAELHQPPTPHHGVESWTTFTLREPYYIDMAFRCVPTKAAFEGYLGVFWASYINAPLDKSIYFLQEGATLDAPRWVQFCTQEHARDSSVRPEGDNRALPYPAEPSTLFHAISPLRYAVPFYYGRVRDMVLIYIFEPNPHLRFAHSPSGGGATSAGDDMNPAWDFQLVIPDWQVGASYSLKMRAVYKPWAGRADVLEEVARYLRQDR